MAINFPNAPLNGQTYDYDGVRYTWKDGTPSGFWQVVGPGTYGVATATDIDEGTDDVKYVTSLGLKDSTKVVRNDEETVFTQPVAVQTALHSASDNLVFNTDSDLDDLVSSTNFDGIKFDDTADLDPGQFNFLSDTAYTDFGNAQLNAGSVRSNSHLILAARKLGSDVRLRAENGSGTLQNCLAAVSESGGDTYGSMFAKGIERIRATDDGVDVSGRIIADNIGHYRYTTSDYPETNLGTQIIGSDTNLSVKNMTATFVGSGTGVMVSGYFTIDSFSQQLPQDGGIDIRLSLDTALSGSPWTGFGSTSYGTGTVIFGGGSGYDFGVGSVRVTASSTNNEIRVFSAQIDSRPYSGSLSSEASTTANFYFSVCLSAMSFG